MKRLFYVLISVLLFSTSALADLKIKTRTTVMGHTTEGTVYIKGARQRTEMERALRKIVMVPTIPIRTASDFLAAFGQRHAFRFDTSQVQNDEAWRSPPRCGLDQGPRRHLG